MERIVIARSASSDHKAVTTHLQFRWLARSRAKRKDSVVIGKPNRHHFDDLAAWEAFSEPMDRAQPLWPCSLHAMVPLMFRSED